jgi:hypothetical protein
MCRASTAIQMEGSPYSIRSTRAPLRAFLISWQRLPGLAWGGWGGGCRSMEPREPPGRSNECVRYAPRLVSWQSMMRFAAPARRYVRGDRERTRGAGARRRAVPPYRIEWPRMAQPHEAAGEQKRSGGAEAGWPGRNGLTLRSRIKVNGRA